jgi:hypothetical protein
MEPGGSLPCSQEPSTGPYPEPDQSNPSYLSKLRYINHKYNVGFEVLTMAVMKHGIFWDITPCSQYMNRGFGGTYHLYLQGRKSAEQETSETWWLGTWFPARLIFDPEAGGDTFLRNVGSYTDYTAVYPTR